MPDFETHTVNRNQTLTFSLDDGETLENKLIDITAPGASVRIDARANKWTLRNIGVKGQHPGRNNVLLCGVPGSNSTGTVENVYLGDGFAPGSKGGIFVHPTPGHRGDLTFRNVHVAHSSNNGLYASGPGSKGQTGTVDVIDSYFYANNIANVRLGSPGGTSRVVGTTIHVDDSVNGCDMNCSAPGAVNARGVWAWAGRVSVEDCDIQTNGHGRDFVTRNATIEKTNVRTGSNADTSPPDGVPMSAEQAASGGTPVKPFDNELVIVGDGTETNYTLRVGTDQRLEASPADDATFNSVDDNIDGDTATGKVFGGIDAYRFDGEIGLFEHDGALATLTLNDEELDPATFRKADDSGSGDSGTDEPAPAPDPDPAPAPPAGDVDSIADTPDSEYDSITRNRYIQTGSNELGLGAAVPAGQKHLIEHVYIRSTSSSDKPAIWVNPNNHRGELHIRNVHIEGHADNAIYSENQPPHGNGGGRVVIEDCYLHDNTRGMLRINGNTEIRNTHIHNTGKNFPTKGYVSRGGYSWYRGGGEILFRNCQIDMPDSAGYNGSPADVWKTYTNTVLGSYGDQIPHVTFRDCDLRGTVQAPSNKLTRENVGANPTIDPPKGVPMTVGEARDGSSSATGPTWTEVATGSGDTGNNGSGGDGPSGDYDHVLVINGAGPNTETTYQLEVSGDLIPTNADGGSFNAVDDTIEGSAATGKVFAGVDAFEFNGDIVSLAVDGEVTAVTLDGETLQPNEDNYGYGGYGDGNYGDGADGPSGGDSGSGDDGGTGPGGGAKPNQRRLGLSSPKLARNIRLNYLLVADGVTPVEGTIEDEDSFYELPDGKVLVAGSMFTGGFADEMDVTGDIHVFDADDRLSVTLDGESVEDPTA